MSSGTHLPLRDTGFCSRCQTAPTATADWPWQCLACRVAENEEEAVRLALMLEKKKALEFGATPLYDPGLRPVNIAELPRTRAPFDPFQGVTPIVLEHLKQAKKK